MRGVRPLVAVLVAQLVLGGVFLVLVATDNLPFVDDGGGEESAGDSDRPADDRFDGAHAFELLEEQVELGPRPAGSAASRRLARRLRGLLPRGRYQAVPGGLRNVVGTVAGREPGRLVVVAAHYDTKDIPGFVGANDGASGTAVVTELARTIEPRELDATVVFLLLDGEESPAGTPDEQFVKRGLRGSRVAARAYRGADAMVLLDFVGERGLRIPREGNSDPTLWSKLRAAARRVGTERTFPPGAQRAIADDHLPFIRRGVPAIDLIDFEFACYHRTCDDLAVVSEESVDTVGETVLELLPTL
jgi:glutaminyl-peptide cyclotransferase